MSETLNLSTSHMSDADLKAIANYLKDQPGQQQTAPRAVDETTNKAGAQIYADECSGCHTPNGKLDCMAPTRVVEEATARKIIAAALDTVQRGSARRIAGAMRDVGGKPSG